MLCDGHIDVLTNGQLGDSALQGVLVTLQPGGQQHDRSLLAQQLAELDGGTAGLDDFDHIARLDLVRGDVDTLAIDSEVVVGNQLAGVAAGLGKAQTVDDVVETALDEDQQVDTSLAGHAGGLLVVGMELVLQDTIDELDLLLLVQLGGVLALLLSCTKKKYNFLYDYSMRCGKVDQDEMLADILYWARYYSHSSGIFHRE